MKNFLLSFLIIGILALSISVDLDTYYKEYIYSFGYTLEENQVTTSDGYILSIWHLTPKNPNGKVVFLQHGLADTAWTFFLLNEKSIPFILLEEGFDVWLGNTRGNIFSHGHVSKDPYDLNSGYDYYTIDDFVQFDLISTINFIKEKTGVEKMSYIGHSQGTTMFFMLVMHNPSFAEESFDHFIALGAVPNIAYTHFTPIEILDKIAGILKAVDIFDTFNLSNTQRKLVSNFCKFAPGICGKFLDAASAIKPSGRADSKELYKFMYYYPGGVSKTNLLHWSQIHIMKKLVYYNPNFDKEKTAEAYDINNLKKWKIRALVARTDDDTFSSYEDVTEFYATVEDKSYIQILDLNKYSHFDCLSSESAIEDIFYPIVNFLNN
jgi:pimeloyl-ACP methyl ester carboxylesterase